METEVQSWTEIARESFPTQYRGDEREEVPATGRSLTLDQTYEQRHEAKETIEAEPEPAEAVETVDEDLTAEAVWSTQDMETFSLLEREAVTFQHDLNAYAQLKNADLSKLTGGNKAETAALQAQIASTEKELETRYNALAQQAQELQRKAHDKIKQGAERKLQSEWKKLEAERPDFDKQANIDFLQGLGFTSQEIATVGDARLAGLVDDARRYREQKPRKGKILTRKTKIQPKEASEVRKARERLRETGSVNDAYALLQAQKRQRAGS